MCTYTDIFHVACHRTINTVYNGLISCVLKYLASSQVQFSCLSLQFGGSNNWRPCYEQWTREGTNRQ